VNGELIKVRMQHNANALEALLGAARPLKLYGPDGQTTPHGPGRINDAA
jgi:flagellar biosynthesis/type III secretory pathway chaperone